MKIENIFSVKDKIVLITGGSRGIGEMIASGFVFSIMIATASGVTGSRYVASAKLRSVIIVAGLEFTKITL